MSNVLFEDDKLGETTLELNWKAVRHNLAYFRNKLNPHGRIMLMVKASAYGNGAIGVSTLAEKEQLADYLGVVNIDEGMELRKAGIKLPIMVQNPNGNQWATLLKHHLEPEIHNLELLQSYIQFIATKQDSSIKNYPLHLKFNTGMNRLGMNEDDLTDLIDLLKQSRSLSVKSVMTHLSSAGKSQDDGFTEEQFLKFDAIIESLKPQLDPSTLFHALNTEGVERHSAFQHQMVRLGIGIFGSSTIAGLQEALIPATKLKTKVISNRRVKKGETISYSRSGKVDKDSNIAVISIGYADGFPIRLGNGNWEIEIGGKLYPTIGVVCMDLCMVNMGDDVIENGEDAIIFGGIKSIFEYADAMETIPYEAMTSISSRVKKMIISG